MREPLKDKNRLEHIINAIDIILQRAEGMVFEDLTADKIVFAGMVYYTMIIGEATYKLSSAFVESHPQVNWRIIANMRHHLVHGYYQVSPLDVWDVIQNDLHPLREQIRCILNETNWDEWLKKSNNNK